MSETADLVGYWPMKDDLLDHSGNGLASDARDVKLSGCPDGRRGCAGRFNGASSVIEVRNHPSLNFGTGDFTIATWIYTESTCDVVGDIVGKFEGDDRSGFNFAVVSNAGVTSTQSNYRNVHFGIDNGRSDSNWVNCGRPGNAAQVSGLAVWQGYLYAGTFEMSETGLGHVWKYLGESRCWIWVHRTGATMCTLSRYMTGNSTVAQTTTDPATLHFRPSLPQTKHPEEGFFGSTDPMNGRIVDAQGPKETESTRLSSSGAGSMRHTRSTGVFLCTRVPRNGVAWV